MKNINSCDYQELEQKALSNNSTVEDRLALLKWFENYGNEYWNGESYGIGETNRLYPIDKGVGEPDEDGDYMEYETVDAEIR